MTVLNPPIAVQSRADTNADDFRGALAAHGMGAGTTLLPRSGIVPGWGAELSVAQRATPGMGVLVGSGVVRIAAPTAGHGGWPVINDASLDVAIASSDPAQPRTDLIIVRVADPQYYAGGDGLAAIKAITGVAGAGAPVPVPPTADGAYVVLGQVAVAAGATSITNANITLNTSASRPFTVAAGGILPVANAAARTALSAHVGMHVIELDTAREYVCTAAPGTWAQVADAATWVAWTPTFTNFTATLASARYKQTGKTVVFNFDITLTAAPTAAMGMSLPVAPRTAGGDVLVGTVSGYAAAGWPTGSIYLDSPNSRVAFSGGGGASPWATSVPVAWANGNIVRGIGTYEAA